MAFSENGSLCLVWKLEKALALRTVAERTRKVVVVLMVIHKQLTRSCCGLHLRLLVLLLVVMLRSCLTKSLRQHRGNSMPLRFQAIPPPEEGKSLQYPSLISCQSGESLMNIEVLLILCNIIKKKVLRGSKLELYMYVVI